MGLLDISGFFTGLIINLLLITLVCYYFKRKYENIESAQMEQAKVLYELLSKKEPTYVLNKEQPPTDKEVESELESEDEDDCEDEFIQENLEKRDEADYNKMSVKTLRDLLTNKGIKINNKMKKNELIRLVNNKKSLVIDLAFDENHIEVEKLPESSEDN